MKMIQPFSIASPCLLAASAVSAGARDRPGTPADMSAKALSPTAVGYSFANTAARDELVRFEVEQTVDGVRISPAAEAAMSAGFVSGTGDGWVQHRGATVRDLRPQTEYCFRARSRRVDSGVRSAGPSNWGCARTPPHPPRAPLDVVAVLTNVATDTPRVSWSTPDQSGWQQQRISALEEQIAHRREFYNEAVNINNVRMEQAPDRLLVGLAGLVRRALFEASAQEREDVDIGQALKLS